LLRRCFAAASDAARAFTIWTEAKLKVLDEKENPTPKFNLQKIGSAIRPSAVRLQETSLLTPA